MVHVNTERLIAEVSAQVSAIDGIQYTVYTPELSGFMGTFVEFMQKMMTRIDTPSATVVSGGSTAAVTVTVVQAASGPVGASGIYGHYQGWPFHAMSAGSGDPGANAATTSTQARKVLVTMAISDLPVASSIAGAAGSLQFVYGSVFTTVALAASDGGVSSIFNQIPLPKASAGEIPMGWLNITNSYTASDGIDNTMMITDYREIQGYDFSAILGNVIQP